MDKFFIGNNCVSTVYFAIYKWIKAEKRVNELQEDKHGLQLDKLHLEREVSWLKNKDNKTT